MTRHSGIRPNDPSASFQTTVQYGPTVTNNQITPDVYLFGVRIIPPWSMMYDTYNNVLSTAVIE